MVEGWVGHANRTKERRMAKMEWERKEKKRKEEKILASQSNISPAGASEYVRKGGREKEEDREREDGREEGREVRVLGLEL